MMPLRTIPDYDEASHVGRKRWFEDSLARFDYVYDWNIGPSRVVDRETATESQGSYVIDALTFVRFLFFACARLANVLLELLRRLLGDADALRMVPVVVGMRIAMHHKLSESVHVLKYPSLSKSRSKLLTILDSARMRS